MRPRFCGVWNSPAIFAPDAAAWRAMDEYADSMHRGPGSGLADLPVMLLQAVMMTRPSTSVLARWRSWRARSVTSSGSYLPGTIARRIGVRTCGFSPAIEVRALLAKDGERIARHSRAQMT